MKRLTCTVGLVVAFGLAACGPPPVAPLPADRPSPTIAATSAQASPSATATPTSRRSPVVRPTRSATPSPAGTPACRGAVTFTVDAAENGPPWPAFCVAVGSLLRLENHGPEGVSVNPAENVLCAYEAAVRECRFLDPGTVRFTIERETDTRTLTVVVVP